VSASSARIAAVIRKEWADLRKNRTLASLFVIMPTLMTSLAIGLVVTATHLPPTKPGTDPAEALSKLPPAIASKVSTPAEAAMLAFVYVALMLLLVIPATIPSIIATHSIIGEKQSRTLEPLLATPIRTWELLVAKVVATATPAIVPTLIGASVYITVAARLLPQRVASVVLSPEYILTLALLGPLVAVLAVSFAITISARSADVQSAQGLAGMTVLPVIGFGVGQMLSGALLSVASVIAAAFALVVLDALVLAFCVALFERETILTRWK
jgi:ABC-2 type transport system permease protein